MPLTFLSEQDRQLHIAGVIPSDIWESIFLSHLNDLELIFMNASVSKDAIITLRQLVYKDNFQELDSAAKKRCLLALLFVPDSSSLFKNFNSLDDHSVYYELLYRTLLDATEQSQVTIIERYIECLPKSLLLKLLFEETSHILYTAIQNKDISSLTCFGKFSPETIRSMNGDRLFIQAAANNNLYILNRVIKLYPSQVEKMLTAGNQAAFSFAAAYGYLDILKRLIELGPNRVHEILASNEYGAFSVAAAHGQLGVLDFLITLATDVQSMVAAKRYAPFSLAAINGQLDVLHYLSNHFPDQVEAMVEATLSIFSGEYAIEDAGLPVVNYLMTFSSFFAVAESAKKYDNLYVNPFVQTTLDNLRQERLTFEQENVNVIFDITHPDKAKLCFYMIRNIIRRNDPALLSEMLFLLDIPAVKSVVRLDATLELMRLSADVKNRMAALILLNIPLLIPLGSQLSIMVERDSLPLFFTKTIQGHALLAANNYQLASSIDASILNHVWTEDPIKNYTVGALLASTSPGRTILAADNNRIAKLINSYTLNQLVSEPAPAPFSDTPNNEEARLPLLFVSIKNNQIETVKFLLTIFGAQINIAIPEGPFKGFTPYTFAIYQKNKEILKLFNEKNCPLSYHHNPMSLDVILKHNELIIHSAITSAFINNDIPDLDLDSIPNQIKTIFFGKDVSLDCLEKLEKCGKKLSSIDMFIDDKYFGGRNPKLHRRIHASKAEQVALPGIKDIYENPDEHIVVSFKPLKSLKKANKSSVFALLENTHYLKANLKPHEISQDDNVFVVFAGRKDKASLPPISDNSQCRCLVVLTKEEFAELNISSNSELLNYYDFLFPRTRKKSDGTDAVLSKLTERRRAALDFILERELTQVVFMDDNVSDICLKKPSSNKTYEDALYDCIKAQMQSSNEAFISIPTYSKLHKRTRPHQLGCKVWALNIATLKAILPGSSIKACFPDNEYLWGEDYFFQVLLNMLFLDNFTNNNRQGYKILDPSDIQLKRLGSAKSLNARSGMTVRIYKLCDVISLELQAIILSEGHQSTLLRIEKAVFLFNHLVNKELNRYNQAFAHIQNMDLDAHRANSSDLTHQTDHSNFDFLALLNQVINPNILDNASINYPLFLHQQQKAIEFFLTEYDYNISNDFLFNMATGTGKSLLIITFALAFLKAFQEKNVIIICPRIQLVHQLLEGLYGKYKPVFNHFNLPEAKIYGVCSKPCETLGNHSIITSKFLLTNTRIHDSGHIYIFCESSFKIFITDVKEKLAFLSKASLFAYDESHSLSNTIALVQEHVKALPTTQLKFSATPESMQGNGHEFTYLRQEAIMENKLSPLCVDKTLPLNCTSDQIKHCIVEQTHPNGGVLKQHKGIIYVNNTGEATALGAALKESLGQDFVYVIHSQDISQKNNFDNFKAKTQGIAIVVQMLVEGYDDDNVDYVIVLKKQQAGILHQQVGRALRKNTNNSNKVGYAILVEGNEKNDEKEQTIFPMNIESYTMLTPPLVSVTLQNCIKSDGGMDVIPTQGTRKKASYSSRFHKQAHTYDTEDNLGKVPRVMSEDASPLQFHH